MREISSSDFAAQLGVGRPTISKALHGPLKAAKVRRGVIDLDHPCVADYEKSTKRRLEQYAAGMKKRGVKKGRRLVKKRGDGDQAEKPDSQNKLDDEQVDMVMSDFPDDIRKIAELPLVDVIRRYGTASSLKEFVTAVKHMEQTQKIQLENREKEGGLVERALLTALLGILDGAYLGLLKDGAKTITRRVIQKAKGGETSEDIEGFVRETIGGYLKNANNRIKLAVRQAKA